MKDKLTIFIERLRAVGIEIEVVGNIPWVYIYSINGKHVKERFMANHCFTVAFLPIKPDQEIEFTDISEIFKLIRKYAK